VNDSTASAPATFAERVASLEVRVASLEQQFRSSDAEQELRHRENLTRLDQMKTDLTRLLAERGLISRIVGGIWLLVAGLLGALLNHFFSK